MKWFNNKPTVKDEMSRNMQLANSDKVNLSKLPCPQCNETKLRPISVERGAVGWEAKFFCDACKTAGVLNHTGFHVELSHSEKDKK
jgi:hypothetical protein